MEELQTTEPIEFLELVEPVEAVDFGDLYLRFKDEDEATEVLEGYAGAVDVIGVIFKPSGETGFDAEGNEVPVMTAVDGWHVNVRGPMTLELQAFAVTPEQPVRVWA
jgi:hypothetical protein